MNLREKAVNHAWSFGFGGMEKKELECLFEICLNQKVLELGCEMGQSSYVIASAAQSVVCVDVWDDSYRHLDHDEIQKGVYVKDLKLTKLPILNGRTIFEQFQKNCKEFIDSGKLTFHKGNTNDVHALFPNVSFNVILIDADHSLHGVRLDIENYLPKLKNDGLMLFHDFNDSCWKGVTQAILEAVADEKIVQVTSFNRIGVFRKHENQQV